MSIQFDKHKLVADRCWIGQQNTLKDLNDIPDVENVMRLGWDWKQ